MNLVKRSLQFNILLIAHLAATPLLRTQEADRASQIYSDASKSVFLLVIKSERDQIVGQGTGFLVTGSKIITNAHVVRGGAAYIDLGAVKLPLSIERVDEFNDLAVLKASLDVSAPVLTLADAAPQPGSSIYAIGNPAGLERSISTGVIAGVREFKGRQLLQITSPMSPGSSGGPILNSRAEVIGVAVGTLEQGQNLNFAVPVTLVQKLLRGEISPNVDVISLIEKVDILKRKQAEHEYSADPGSPWGKLDYQIDAALQNALERSGNNADLLIKVAEKAEGQNIDIQLRAAELAVRAKPTAVNNLALAKALRLKAFFAEDQEKSTLLERAETAIRAAMSATKQPTHDMHFLLAGILETRSSYTEADGSFRRALELSKLAGDEEVRANSLRGLVRTSYALDKTAEGEAWFKALVATGKATAWDFYTQGQRLDKVVRFLEAGQSYVQAALLGGSWENWCEAATSFVLAGNEQDRALYSGRKCLSEGSGKRNSDNRLGSAHYQIANILNDRGVYQEALSHSKEAVLLDRSNPWAFNAQAEALIGLRRFQEAINASTQAVRLSDGKYASMHFNLGSAYFDVENWEFAKQSFEKAAQIGTKDDAAPYNVALCLTRLGYGRDAANWYQEVLRRNPTHPERDDIQRRIQILRQ